MIHWRSTSDVYSILRELQSLQLQCCELCPEGWVHSTLHCKRHLKPFYVDWRNDEGARRQTSLPEEAETAKLAAFLPSMLLMTLFKHRHMHAESLPHKSVQFLDLENQVVRFTQKMGEVLCRTLSTRVHMRWSWALKRNLITQGISHNLSHQ